MDAMMLLRTFPQPWPRSLRRACAANWIARVMVAGSCNLCIRRMDGRRLA